MKTKLLALVILFLWVMPTFAQVDTTWVRRYTGPGNLGDPAGNIDTNNTKKRMLLPVENLTVRLRSPSLSKVEGKGRSPALYGAGRSARDFLTPDGRIDLKAIRESGYQGPLDLKGLNVATDPHTGEPVLAPANAKVTISPDDTFWTDKFSCAAGLGGICYALCVYNGKLIAGGYFSVANCTLATNIASWNGSSWSPLGLGINDSVRALAVYNNKLIVGGHFTTAGGCEC